MKAPVALGHVSLLLLVSFTIGGITAFTVAWQPVARHQTALQCICIDCARVTNCAAYHFVETKHQQPHMTTDPTFTPQEGSPTIHVNIRTVRNSQLFGQIRSEHEIETTRALQVANDATSNSLHGETVYDLAPVTTYEYDVVQCADFVSDAGCWVRHMPEEIRRANPDFVPT